MRYSQKRAHVACALIAIAINLFSIQLSFGQSPGGTSSGLIWWLKADADVLTGESGPAAVDGDKLYKWLDKSSTAVHAYSQNNGIPSQDWRPTFKSNIINGNPVLRFSKNHFVTRSSSSVVGHVFMVLKHNSAPASTGTASDENGAYIVDRSSIGAGSRFSLKIANTDKYCIQKQNSSGSTSSFTTSATTATAGSFTILDYYLNTGASQFGVGLNGAAHETGSGTSDNTFQNPFKFGLHQSNGTDLGFDGDLAELIVYNSNPTSTERQKIESYLAIKYGITLNQSTATNYLSSSGTTVYPATTTHDSYDIDIAGIAKDDGSGLNQTASQSQNSNSIVKISNPSSLADGDFLVWGANSTSTAVSASVASPYRRRLNRVWRAAETNDVGTVTISFDLTGTGIDMSEFVDFALLIDSDGDFTSGATVHTTGRTVNTSTNIVTFTTASINNNDYFTLTTDIIPGPGWVINNLRWWLRADAGVVTNAGNFVTQWTDQSQVGNNATQSGADALRPSYQTSVINGNPVLRFSGDQYVDAGSAPGISSNAYFFAVLKLSSSPSSGGLTDGSGTYIIDRTTTGTPLASLKIVNTSKNYGFQKRDNASDLRGVASTDAASTSSFAIVDYFRNTAAPSTALGIGVNGRTQATNSDVTNGLTADPIRVGRHSTTASSGINGDIAEFVVYNSTLTSTERQQAESYLGIKYGITLDQTTPTNYLSASGAIVYPAASTHDSYDQDIAGIAKDYYSKLNQTSGKSQNSGSIVTVSNPSSLDHDDYLLWGHDGGSITTANETDVPAPYATRLTRIWRAAETNDVGTVTISFDLSSTGISVSRVADFALLIDSDGTFSNATVHTTGRSINGSVITFTTASINNNDYFTIATSVSAPGGVTNNLRWWLKADAGVLTNASNFVTQWNDQSGVGNNATQSGADALRPTYQTSIINGNPVLRFSGNQYIDAGSAPGISSNAHFFAVLKLSSSPSSGGFTDGSGMYITDRTTSGTPLASLKIVNTNKNYGFQKRDNASDLRGVASTDAASTSSFAIVDYFRNTATPSTALGIGVNGRTQATNSDVTNGLTADPIRVGRHSTTASSGINGDLAEFVVFSESLTSTERQQVESYLGIKYGITVDQTTPTNYLSASGSVVYPAASTHDSYDQDIAGIAKDYYSKLTQTSGKSQNSGNMITVSNPSSLENGDYLLWGHDNGSITSPDNSDVTGTIQRRMSRVWKVAETNEVGTVDIEIDLTNVPGSKQQADLRLLIDRDNDGFNDNDVTPLTGTLTGQIFKVTGVNFSNGDKFTVGTINTTTTPLPISLLDFEVQPSGISSVIAGWTTAHEVNNDYFTLERSKNGLDFIEALKIPGAGNSNEEKQYEAVDNAPYSGRSYYRLKQTDFDGTSTYSDIKTVKLVLESSLFPNPNDGNEFSLSLDVKRSSTIQIDILNASGVLIYSETQPASREGMQTFIIRPDTHLHAGLYYAKAKYDGEETGFKFVVR